MLGIGSPDVDEAVDSGLEEDGMLSEYQELSLLSALGNIMAHPFAHLEGWHWWQVRWMLG